MLLSILSYVYSGGPKSIAELRMSFTDSVHAVWGSIPSVCGFIPSVCVCLGGNSMIDLEICIAYSFCGCCKLTV